MASIAKHLTREDFVLREDGKPQTITYFSRESDLPVRIGLLVDTSRSQTGVLEPERKASHIFFHQVRREDKDLAFVAHFDTQVGILQGFTSSRHELAAALEQLRIPSGVATLLYEAIRQRPRISCTNSRDAKPLEQLGQKHLPDPIGPASCCFTATYVIGLPLLNLTLSAYELAVAPAASFQLNVQMGHFHPDKSSLYDHGAGI